LFSLDDWAEDASELIEAMDVELVALQDKRDHSAERLAHEFAVSVVVVRHLQLDPQLPVELVPHNWPAHRLRSTYRRFDDAFQQLMYSAFRRT
ncbi:PaaX family transcriptional regulator C-terminal domain-containing protein, partial [Mycobacterium sp.]|uniref:PaaX family transcriptional regulator C-terminal domain-containing protein n=1 Tax=Mycobacterium sp. TaxID=1785 RepID=UPI002C1E6C77